jgi:hypothetical protein
VERCGLVSDGGCGVGPLGRREGWGIDPSAHPVANPVPYLTWAGADYVMTVLDRFHGDFYGCLGSPKMTMPPRPVVRDGPSQPGYVVLRKGIPQWPAGCFEFEVAAAGAGRAVIQNGVAFVTSLAARENWEVDPSLGGPYPNIGEAEVAHGRLDRFRGNFYNCPMEGTRQRGGPTQQQPPPGGISVSGGFDPDVVDAEVKHGASYNARVTFEGPALTLQMSPNQAGTAATISPSAVQVIWNYSRPDGTLDRNVITMRFANGRVMSSTWAQGPCTNIIVQSSGRSWQSGVVRPYTMPDQRPADLQWSATYDSGKRCWRIAVGVGHVPPWVLR